MLNKVHIALTKTLEILKFGSQTLISRYRLQILNYKLATEILVMHFPDFDASLSEIASTPAMKFLSRLFQYVTAYPQTLGLSLI